MKIAIIGTRGIPNRYGGFEQLAEYLSTGLADKGHEVYVYNSHDHDWQEAMWKNVHILYCYDPEKKMGTAGQFIYDLNCVRDARKRSFDVILILGYTSISVWGRWFDRKPVTVINMDGLEWKRTKYSRPVRRFLRYAERLAVKFCDFFIADSPAIQKYLKDKYRIPSEYIAYGAEVFDFEDEMLLEPFGVRPGEYYMIMARMEPENNIETVLDGFHASVSPRKLLVVGNTGNRFGQYLVKKFGEDARIRFTGAIYDAKVVHTLKVYSTLYFHGHSVGGTNPSLLEAMASRALIAAHDNVFNKAILGEDAFYFRNAGEVQELIDSAIGEETRHAMVANNLRKIREDFTWEKTTDRYERFLTACYASSNKSAEIYER
jgi:glycosyltransferase involved in cell wall biosynthesis